MRTEQIRCVLCNKHLDTSIQSGKEMLICAECQAYFCPDCVEAVRNYTNCPAARLLGVNEHELKFIKLLPPKVDLKYHSVGTSKTEKSVKILPNKSIKVIDDSVKKKNNH